MRIESTNNYHDYQNNFDGGSSAPANGANPADAGHADGANSEDSLSSLLTSGDVGAQVAAMLVMHAQSQRDISRQTELAENAALDRAADAEVQAMHDKADATRLSGFCEGLGTMASGVASYGANTSSDSSTENWKLGGALSKGASDRATSFFKAEGDDADARSKQFKHESDVHGRNAKSAADTAQENQKLLEHALDFYKQYSQGVSEAQKTSVGR